MRQKAVAVSRLADYAADPDGFIKRRGGPRNAHAAAAGTRHHDRLGRSNAVGWWILALALLGAVVLLVNAGYL